MSEKLTKETRPSVQVTNGGSFFDQMDAMRRRFDELLAGYWPDNGLFSWSSTGTISPRVDAHETDTQVELSVEVPGMSEEQIQLEITGQRLTVKGEKKAEKQHEDGETHFVKRSYGSFQRSFTLPDTAEGAKASAKFDKGVLNIAIPKKPAQKVAEHRVKINV